MSDRSADLPQPFRVLDNVLILLLLSEMPAPLIFAQDDFECPLPRERWDAHVFLDVANRFDEVALLGDERLPEILAVESEKFPLVATMCLNGVTMSRWGST